MYYFRGENFFLSNFYPIEIIFDGKVYGSVEHAFQAAKCANPIDAEKIRTFYREIKPNWESEKVTIMERILRVKFADPEMKRLLKNTKDVRIVENNGWHDIYWGVCDCPKHESTGKNIVGELLMLIRDNEKLYLNFE